MTTITVNGKAPPLKIINLADMKRAVSIPGINIEVVSHWLPYLVGTERTPEKVQGNGYWFMSPKDDGTIVRMWAQHPPASQLRFYGDDRVTFHPDTPKCWTLRFVNPGSE